MKRWEKLTVLFAILFYSATLGFVYWGFSTQENWRRVEQVVTIWLPENYLLLNKRAGTYASIIEVQFQGIVSYISFEEFQQAFDNASIAIGARGKVVYWNDEGAITIATSKQLKLSGGSFPDEIQILSDKDIKLVEDVTFGTALLSFIDIIVTTILGLPAGFVTDKVWSTLGKWRKSQ